MQTTWYQNAVFYQVNLRAFYDSNGDGYGDLRGLTQKLDYIQALGVDCLWLMPMYPSPLKDDGYDISDYCNIDPHYGTLEDLQELLYAAHGRGLRVILDLVMNHTSDQHPWFQAARADRNSPYRDYYVWSDTDQRYQEARIIFLDTEPSNWTWDAQAGQYFWHRFYSSQPDLNYDSPAVRQEMKQIMKFWLDLGVDGFRADAVPYLFEREGTNCENLPETHAYLKELRRFVEENYPGRILLCEANQWPQDVRAYFGASDEFHMAFHFPLMPRIYLALRKGDRTPLDWVLAQTPAIPENCQWCTFLRNHDELTLEMVTEEDRQWMWQQYAPEPRMRLNLGIRRRLAPLLDFDRRKIECANVLLYSFPGAPIVYYGDEIGMGDNLDLPDRNGVRTPMQWNNTHNAGFSTAHTSALYTPPITSGEAAAKNVNVEIQAHAPDSLLQFMQTLIRLRKEHPALSSAAIQIVDTPAPAVAAYWRGTGSQRILAIVNLSDHPQTVHIPLNQAQTLLDVFSGQTFTPENGRLSLNLKPFGYSWLK